jgi:hypothetical protein
LDLLEKQGKVSFECLMLKVTYHEVRSLSLKL